MRFGRKTVLDTDPPEKIKGRSDLNYHYYKDNGWANTQMNFGNKGNYKNIRGLGQSFVSKENMPWNDFFSKGDYFRLDGSDISATREEDLVHRGNLREYFREYPGTDVVKMRDARYDQGDLLSSRIFETRGRDELGTTFGLTQTGDSPEPSAFIVTDPEVNTLIDLPAKTPAGSVPPNMELRNVMPEIYSRKLDQRNGQYIYETSEGTVRKKIGVEDARYIHQNRKAFNAMRKNR